MSHTVTGTSIVPPGVFAPVPLARLALVDTQLALSVRALVDLCEEADWPTASRVADDIAQRIRWCDLESRTNHYGVVHPHTQTLNTKH